MMFKTSKMEGKARIMIPRFFVPQRHLRIVLLFALVPLCALGLVLYAWKFNLFNSHNDFFDSRFASGTRQQLERELLIMNLMNEMSTGQFGPVRQKENDLKSESIIWFPSQRRRAIKIENMDDAIHEFIVYVLNLILFPDAQVIPLTSLRMEGIGIQERPGGFVPVVELCYDGKWTCAHEEFNPMEDGDVCFLTDKRWFPKIDLDQVKILAFLLNAFDTTRCALIPNREDEQGGTILVGYSFKSSIPNNNEDDNETLEEDGWKLNAICNLDPIVVQTIKWLKSSRGDIHSLITAFMHRSTLPKSVQWVVSEHEEQISRIAEKIKARFDLLVEILDTKCQDVDEVIITTNEEDDDDNS